ncbi:tripartite tricarboxylate transporter TctB family protein [Paenalcaligenes hominis]|uniref:tripartite tricarboxylate transporter TctB family protein n=1 Tax=Paenalcaligenes hominis TaxID=643674 RepID=UPI003525D3D9
MIREKRQVLALAFIALAVAVYMYAGTFPLGEGGDPGPRVFPRAIAIVMGGLAILQFLISIKSQPSQTKAKSPTKSKALGLWSPKLTRCYVFLLLIMVLALAFEWLGAYSATALFLLISFFFLNKSTKNKLLYSVVWALGFTAAIYLVFEEVFSIPLPAGLFI